MPIQIKPVIIPQKVLNKLWILWLEVTAGLVGGKAWLSAKLMPYNTVGEGENQVVNDVGTSPIVLDAIDVLEEIKIDPEAKALYDAFMAYVVKKAIQQGKIELDA